MTTLGIADWGGPAQPFRIETRRPIVHRPGAASAAIGSGNMPVVTRIYGWLCAVDRRIERTLTVGLIDLPERCWRDDYDDRVPPSEAADLAIDEAAAEFGIEPAVNLRNPSEQASDARPAQARRLGRWPHRSDDHTRQSTRPGHIQGTSWRYREN